MPELPSANPPDAPFSMDPGWTAPDDAFLRSFLALPELAIVEESSAQELRLHEDLHREPRGTVDRRLLDALGDDDVRANYEMFLGFRDALLAAGTLEAHYLALVRGGSMGVPPVFVAKVAEAIARHLFDGSPDPFERRAAQLLYRPQRITISDGRVLAADLEGVERSVAPSADPIGTLLRQGAAPDPATSLPVLGAANAAAFGEAADPRAFVFDLTHEMASEVGHGLTFTLARAHSGLSALARVLERWIAHFLRVATTIRPLPRIDDAAWVWHIGLDVESTALLNDLYRGTSVDEPRLQRLIGLFRLDFADPAEMRPTIAGKPVYLGLAMDETQTLKLKAQNLLVNLPLAGTM